MCDHNSSHIHVHVHSKPLRLLYTCSLIVYEIVNFLSSLFTLCYFFLSFYIGKCCSIHVIVHVYTSIHVIVHVYMYMYSMSPKKAPFPFPFRSVPFCYGKTGDFFNPVFPVPSFSPFSRARV